MNPLPYFFILASRLATRRYAKPCSSALSRPRPRREGRRNPERSHKSHYLTILSTPIIQIIRSMNSKWRQHAGRSRWTIRSIFEGILFSYRLANARHTHHERSYVYDPGWSRLIGSPVSPPFPAATVGAFLAVTSVTRGGGLCLSRSLRKTKQFLR